MHWLVAEGALVELIYLQFEKLVTKVGTSAVFSKGFLL